MTHVLMDSFGEDLGKFPVVDCVAIANGPHFQCLLAFVCDEEGTQFFSVCIDAMYPDEMSA